MQLGDFPLSETNGHAPDLKTSPRNRKSHSNPDDASAMYRTAPQSSEAEQGILGCIFLSPNDCLAECAANGHGSVEMFHDIRNRKIYETMLEMVAEGVQVDLITVGQRLKDNKKLLDAGGLVYISTLPDTVPSAANLSHYLQIVIAKYSMRKMLFTCEGIAARIYNGQGETEQLLDDAERQVLAVRPNASTMRTAKMLARSAIDKIELLHQQKGAIGGIPTGWSEVDKLTDGMQTKEVVIVGAETKGGKSSLAMNIADHVAIECKIPVGVFSMEMSDEALMLRMVCARARVNLRNIKEGYLAERDFPKLTGAAGKLAHAAIHIDASSDLTLMQMRAKARRMVQQHGVKLLVVDYLQLLTCPEVSKKGNREQEVSAISKGCKAMAVELDVAVLVISQLNADGQSRESRSAMHDCDQFWKLVPQQEPEENEDPSAIKESVAMWLKVELSRNGPAGAVPLLFLKNYTKFESMSRVTNEDVPPPHQYHD